MVWVYASAITAASMRPPEFTGGNSPTIGSVKPDAPGFNEAAGIHRRKPTRAADYSGGRNRFNEAAGIHRRKRE